MDKDMENPWLDVETWCAEAGESRGVVRVRGGVTPFGKAGRKGCFGAFFGIFATSCGVTVRCQSALPTDSASAPFSPTSGYAVILLVKVLGVLRSFFQEGSDY